MKNSAVRVYLLDVEGTVAPVAFVYEQLFPYARAHFGGFFRDHLKNADVQADLRLLADENQLETDKDSPAFGIEMTDAEHAIAYLTWLMDRDRKSTALKSLQGKIWKAGFEAGELKGALFDDVPEALARWSARGKVAIYSSGSVEAQRLVFRHSIFGDLTGLISNYFDTRTAAKGEPASYAAIAAAMNVAPDEVLFFSDMVRELDAARTAGCQTRLVVREGNTPVGNASEDAHGHAALKSFALL